MDCPSIVIDCHQLRTPCDAFDDVSKTDFICAGPFSKSLPIILSQSTKNSERLGRFRRQPTEVSFAIGFELRH